jgi:hypothetical protein
VSASGLSQSDFGSESGISDPRSLAGKDSSSSTMGASSSQCKKLNRLSSQALAKAGNIGNSSILTFTADLRTNTYWTRQCKFLLPFSSTTQSVAPVLDDVVDRRSIALAGCIPATFRLPSATRPAATRGRAVGGQPDLSTLSGGRVHRPQAAGSPQGRGDPGPDPGRGKAQRALVAGLRS